MTLKRVELSNQMRSILVSVRRLAVEMIDEFAARGEVDIAYDFGRVFPVRVFLDLMGLPFAMFEQFLAWEYEILHSRDHQRMGDAVRQVIANGLGVMGVRPVEELH